MRDKRMRWVGCWVMVVGMVFAGMSSYGDDGAAESVRTKIQLRGPEGVGFDGGELLDHGNRVGRYGGLLNQTENGMEGRSYLDMVELPGKRPSMVCDSGDVGSGFPVFNAAFSGRGEVALYSMIDWKNHKENELMMGKLDSDGVGTRTSLEKAGDWFMAEAVSGDGKRGASYLNQTKAVELWDLAAGKLMGKLDVGVELGLGVLAMDSGGHRVVVGAAEAGKHHLQIWDVESEKKICDCEGSSGKIMTATISADDSTLATADSDGVIWMWSMGTGKGLARIECPTGRLGKLAFSADGKRLVAATDEFVSYEKPLEERVRLHLWDVASAGKLTTLEGIGPQPRSVAFSEDGRSLVTYGITGVMYWDVPGDLAAPRRDEVALAATQPSDGEVSRFAYQAGWAVAFSPDDKRVVVGGTKGVSTWDLGSGKEVGSFTTPFLVTILNPGQDLGVVQSSAGLHGFATMVQLSTGKTVGKADLEGFGYIDAAALSPDGRLFALATGGARERTSPVFTPRVEVMGVSDGKSVCSVKEDIDSVRCMAFSGDGKVLYMASGFRKEKVEDAEVHVVDAATGEERGTFKGLKDVPKAMVVSKDGAAVWVLGEGGMVQGFDAGTGEPIASVGWLGQGFSLAVSPDGRMVAAGLYDHRIVLIDAKTGKVVRQLRRHQNLVLALAFSSDGKRLASASTDGTARVWDVGDALGR